jgi:hypothetical protein
MGVIDFVRSTDDGDPVLVTGEASHLRRRG